MINGQAAPFIYIKQDPYMKILLATKSPFAPEASQAAADHISAAGFEVLRLEAYADKSELLAAVTDVHALIVRSDIVDPEVLDAAKQLKLVIRGGAGYNTIDVAACTERGITVMNTPGQNSNAVAELALALMLAAVRHIVRADVTTKAGEFIKSQLTGTELRGKKLGIHGFGYIGQLLACKARGCGMAVFAYDPWVSEETAKDCGVQMVKDVNTLYHDADFISLHIPKTPKTVHSINADLLALMKPAGVLVNTARAEVIDMDGLEKTLTDRPKFRYAADVQPEGDVAGEKRLAKFGGQTLLMPHIGASTDEANFDTALAAARQAVDFFKYGTMTAAVNKEAVPFWMARYAVLAERLGLLCAKRAAGRPREVQVICYGTLEAYTQAFAGSVFKGIYNESSELTPPEALAMAGQNGVTIRTNVTPDNSRGHGNSITVDYMADTDSGISRVSIRGTVADGMLKVSRVCGFKNVDFQPEGLIALFEYTEKEGMIDVIGEHFTRAGYNKNQGRFIQSPDGKNQICVFQVEKKRSPGSKDPAEVETIAARIQEDVADVYRAIAVQFS